MLYNSTLKPIQLLRVLPHLLTESLFERRITHTRFKGGGFQNPHAISAKTPSQQKDGSRSEKDGLV